MFPSTLKLKATIPTSTSWIGDPKEILFGSTLFIASFTGTPESYKALISSPNCLLVAVGNKESSVVNSLFIISNIGATSLTSLVCCARALISIFDKLPSLLTLYISKLFKSLACSVGFNIPTPLLSLNEFWFTPLLLGIKLSSDWFVITAYPEVGFLI